MNRENTQQQLVINRRGSCNHKLLNIGMIKKDIFHSNRHLLSDCCVHCHYHRLISIQMPVCMSSLMNAGKHIYTITLCVCVRVFISKSPVIYRYFSRTLSKRTRLRSLAYISTHTHRVIVYMCLTTLITTCRPASVLIIIYGHYSVLLDYTKQNVHNT